MSGRGRRGRSRRAIQEAFERTAVPYLREMNTYGSTTASMDHPPTVGQAGPSRLLEGAQVPGLFTTEHVAQLLR